MALLRQIRHHCLFINQLRAIHQIMEARSLSLLHETAYLNGKWVAATSGKTFDVLNPSNGKILGSVPDMDETDTAVAIQAASDAFQEWQHVNAKERSTILRKWYNLLVKNQDEIAKIITAEAGKPLKEALGEVVYGNSFVEWFSEEARRIHGEVLSSPTKTKEMILIKQPIGVAALITPWNFPIAMITRKAGAALAAGCTCVVKPAEDTPFTALAVAELAHEAGIPKGVFNVITCSRVNAPAVGKLLCESPLIAGLSFTGSTEVGKVLYRQCSLGVKRLGLELGGNAPFVVFNDADLDLAVQGAMASKFRNCGQTCVSANRFLIQEEIFNTFVEKLKEKMQTELILGCGSDPKCTLGPLINSTQVKKVHSIVEDAVKKGAKIHLGGKFAQEVGERFYEPTLITNVNPDMTCFTEEIFGPVAVCIKFKTESDALSIANNTNRGLAGYFYSNNIPQAWRFAKQLEVGMVGINEGIISCAEAAFGGIKQSGIGREGSSHGIEEFTYIKYLCFGNM